MGSVSNQFPSPKVTRARLAELTDHLTKMKEYAVSSGIAALTPYSENADNKLWMNLEEIEHNEDDQTNVNRTFQKLEGMKKSANAVVSVLKRPTLRES